MRNEGVTLMYQGLFFEAVEGALYEIWKYLDK